MFVDPQCFLVLFSKLLYSKQIMASSKKKKKIEVQGYEVEQEFG